MDEHLFRNLLQVGMVVSDLDETLSLIHISEPTRH